MLAADLGGIETAKDLGIRYQVCPLDESNYVSELVSRLPTRGDFLLNLSVNVSSISLIQLARDQGWLYLDTSIEPWEGGFQDTSVGPAARSNYAFRQTALALKQGESGPTAVITHGANPGLVSHFVKRALLDIMDKKIAEGVMESDRKVPRSREEWAELARDLGVKTIQVAERDTQVCFGFAGPLQFGISLTPLFFQNTQIPLVPKRPKEFVNTWSVDGFVGEASQPAELGWGTHERHFPHDGRTHDSGPQSSIYLLRPGASTRVSSWTPLEGPYHGFLITHGESISIPDYLTLRDPKTNEAVYRPTVYYAYHPCDSAVLSLHEFCGRNLQEQPVKRVVTTDLLDDGMDELGVLLMGWDQDRVYWYGSRLTMGEARDLCKGNNATSLQVTAPVLAGVIWAIGGFDPFGATDANIH